MKIKNIVVILVLFAGISPISKSYSQCILPLSNGTGSITLSSEKVLGQKFISTCSGELSFITVKSTSALATIPNVTLKLWEYSLISGWNVYYTQSGINLNGQSNPTTIPLTAPDPSITLGETYHFTLHHASINLDLQAQSTGTFLTGNAVKGNSLVRTDALSLNDLYFEIEAVSSLPVDLITFQAIAKDNFINLSWETKSESNNAGFDIQKSYDGEDWENIGFVSGRGDANTSTLYSFQDRTPNPGKNYYRLKQLDFNGQFEYSPISVTSLDYVEEAKIYPNPTNDHVNIYIPELYQRRKVSVFDIHGKMVISLAEVQRFNTDIDISMLPDGMYLVKAGKIPLGSFIKKQF